MDHVLAKIKGHGKRKIFKLISEKTLFNKLFVTDEACVEYAPDHNLDEDSWFKIEQFSQKASCIELLKKNFDSKDYDDLIKGQFAKIAYLFAVQGEDFYFQKRRFIFFYCLIWLLGGFFIVRKSHRPK